MNLVAAFEKLIIEHGSSSILRDHLALFKDQVIELEKENSILKEQNSSLKSQVYNLEKDNAELRKEIQKNNQSGEYRMKWGLS